MKDGSVCRQV